MAKQSRLVARQAASLEELSQKVDQLIARIDALEKTIKAATARPAAKPTATKK